MTTHPHQLRVTTLETQDSVRVEVHGDLDYDNADLLVHEVTAQLTARPGLTDLHLHCAEIGAVDSMGLCALLMISRHTAAAGVRLHLDERSAKLDRLLDLTGTLDHLTAPPPTGTVRSSMTGESTTAIRPTGPDGLT
ncbi:MULTISPECIES: STAS domain-containing protein [Streptomyces]|uniref:STAS domain-containing protein n=1 Tax=Streptomyces TaxID=1883 RepID=UPI001BDC5A4D|nr:STAS domain-containing protein [Streptomyces sp. Tu10]MBT1100004.1 STAS domain-containing protein [Streptomyces sp. Tu10]WUD86894.1 STAS domain-containing protein [Streptomyces anulatus]